MSSHDKPSDVGQPAKYDELNDRSLRSSPHLAEAPTHPGIDGRRGIRGDEPVTDRHGNELRPSRRREWNARDDTAYAESHSSPNGQHADVEAMTGQAAAARIDGDPGELISTSSGIGGAYWQGALVNARDEELPTVPAPFPNDTAIEGEGLPPGAYARERFPLATEERIEGEHAELEQQREKAHAAAAVGIARARRCRAEVTTRARTHRAAARGRLAASTRGEPAPLDPREQLSQAALAAVNEGAFRLAEILTPAPSRAVLARQIAAKVVRGTGVEEAIFATRDEWYEVSGVVQPIETVGSRGYEVTIQGSVETLWEPKDVSQKQVGLVRDATGTAKVTIWKRSGDKPLLHEGDEVRICYGKPGEYNGRPTVAVTADTRVVVLERGDGPAPTRISARSWESATDFTGEQRFEPCTPPAPGEGQAESRITHVPQERRGVPVEQPDAFTKDKTSRHSLTAGAWLQADVVYPSVALIPRFSTEDIERRKAARRSDDPTEWGGASNYDPIGYTVVRLPFPAWWREQASVSEASSEPTGGWFGDEPIADGTCPVPHCDFEGETAKELLGHIGAKVRNHSAGPHAQVQVELAERGVTDIDGESPFDLETSDADAPLADRPVFPPRPGAAYRLSRTFDGPGDAAVAASSGQPDSDAEAPPAAPSTDASGSEPAVVANGGEAVAGPTTTARCPDCGHDRAAYQLQQTRAADEAPTRLYTCTACSHRWREDD